jgi:hypothetical protein
MADRRLSLFVFLPPTAEFSALSLRIVFICPHRLGDCPIAHFRLQLNHPSATAPVFDHAVVGPTPMLEEAEVPTGGIRKTVGGRDGIVAAYPRY